MRDVDDQANGSGPARMPGSQNAASRGQEYIYRVATIMVALVLLLTWISA